MGAYSAPGKPAPETGTWASYRGGETARWEMLRSLKENISTVPFKGLTLITIRSTPSFYGETITRILSNDFINGFTMDRKDTIQ